MFGFFMINALFVLIVFLLQLNKDSLHVKWPISARINVTYDEVTQEVNLVGTSNALLSKAIAFFSYKTFYFLGLVFSFIFFLMRKVSGVIKIMMM